MNRWAFNLEERWGFEFEDPEADELRAMDRAERRRLRPHWCSECLGFTGPGSPCEPAPLDADDDEGDEP